MTSSQLFKRANFLFLMLITPLVYSCQSRQPEQISDQIVASLLRQNSIGLDYLSVRADGEYYQNFPSELLVKLRILHSITEKSIDSVLTLDHVDEYKEIVSKFRIVKNSIHTYSHREIEHDSELFELIKTIEEEAQISPDLPLTLLVHLNSLIEGCKNDFHADQMSFAEYRPVVYEEFDSSHEDSISLVVLFEAYEGNNITYFLDSKEIKGSSLFPVKVKREPGRKLELMVSVTSEGGQINEYPGEYILP